MKPLVGYVGALSVRAGERVSLHVASEIAQRVEVRLVRIAGAGWDGQRALPDVRPTTLPAASFEAAPHRVPLGSHAEAALPGPIVTAGALELSIRVCRHGPARGSAALFGLWCRSGPAGFALAIDADARPCLLEVDAAGATREQPLGAPLDAGQWYELVLRLAWDGPAPVPAALADACARRCQGELRIRSLVGRPWQGALDERVALDEVALHLDDGGGPRVWFAARPGERGHPVAHFDGRLEAPSVRLARSLSGVGDAAAALLASWDFALAVGTERIVDCGPHGCHGRLVNGPARAVTGSRWSGRHFGWRERPDEYAAIHFHADDLVDCEWPASHVAALPTDLPGGLYAFELRGAVLGTDHVPFVVRSAAGAARREVALLLPTYTYLAYANAPAAMRGPPIGSDDGDDERALAVDAVYGRSTYERYRDGSPVMCSAARRPLLSMRFGARPWGFVPDCWIAAWLEREHGEFDVLTDEDLHRDGAAALAGVRVLVTGNHPEYTTREMLDALEAGIGAGLRLIYLGGNGFYWRVAVDPARPERIEVRRAEDGTRAWIAAPGESHHAFDGEYGGLWRRLGRPPNRLVGVGFAAQGFDDSGWYRVARGAREGPAGFALAGVAGDEFGRAGWLGGGAAGQEIDRCDTRNGSPPRTAVIASSVGHPPSMLRTKEEFLSTVLPFADRNARSDLALTAHGDGAVFAVGSMAWAGSLHCDTDVSRVTRNVLRRFLDPTPLGAGGDAPAGDGRR